MNEDSSAGFQNQVTKSALNLQKQKRFKEKLKINNEISRWAFGYDYDLDIDTDSDCSIDDSYLDNIDNIFKSKEELDDFREQRKKKLENNKVVIRNLLERIRRRSLLKSSSYKIKKQFLKNIGNQSEDNKSGNNILNMISKTNNQVNFSGDEDEEDDIDDNNKQRRKFSIPKSATSNKISKAVPGILQQNITLERVFCKDILKLSKQRYISKQGFDFQMRLFKEKQNRKGLIDNGLIAAQNRSYMQVENDE
jgi:hypothetical protein